MPRGEGETLTYHYVLMARGPMHSFPGIQRYQDISEISWDIRNKTGTVPGQLGYLVTQVPTCL